MISKLLIAGCLMALCVIIHAGGMTAVLRRFGGALRSDLPFWSMVWLFIRIAGFLVLLHLLEISAWALVFHWKDAMPDLTSAFYFSSVTYTTTGYGDLVLPESWRLLGGIEALTGILMCGWSTGFFFAVVSRMFRDHIGKGTK